MTSTINNLSNNKAEESEITVSELTKKAHNTFKFHSRVQTSLFKTISSFYEKKSCEQLVY